MVDARVVDHVINEANRKLKDAVKRNFEDADQHLQWFSMCKLLVSSSDSQKSQCIEQTTLLIFLNVTDNMFFSHKFQRVYDHN